MVLCLCIGLSGCASSRVNTRVDIQSEAEMPQKAVSGERISKPGEYVGYSEVLYDGHEMTSQYMEVRDGTKIAIDIFRPTLDGKLVETPLPVLWMHTPYNRRTFQGGMTASNYPGKALQLVKYGYVVAVADFRGLFASFGRNGAFNRGEWLDSAYWDAYDITEWLAEQPWSSGNVGMWGCSATGGSQLQATTSMPPHLQAVFPMSCEFDAYPFGVSGGMSPPPGTSTRMMRGMDRARDVGAAPVDADTDGAMLAAAKAEHKDNIPSAGYVPFRDSFSEALGEQWWIKSSPHTFLDNINKSNVAMYLAANWDEGATKYGAFFTFNNIQNPAKLIIGPATHCQWSDVERMTGFNLIVEELRFFDYWLKGIDNGVMNEPPITYYTYNAPEGEEWRSADQWPLPDERLVAYYLGDKSLQISAPMGRDAKDTVVVDYDITRENRYEKGITYITDPLTDDVEMTGHPVIHLWVSSTATDGDFIARIEDVAPDGTVTSYNMDGRLRASLRALHDPPYNNLGLPWHRFNAEDVKLLTPGEPTLLTFDLYPISYVFKAGHRIRLRITFAESFRTPKLTPAPEVTLYRDMIHPSSIMLPFVGGFAASKAGEAKLIDWKQTGEPLSGPFDVIIEHDPTLATHTIFRPKTLGEMKHPILVWGEGGCVDMGLMVPEYLSEIASHGFLVVADGPPVGRNFPPRNQDAAAGHDEVKEEGAPAAGAEGLERLRQLRTGGRPQVQGSGVAMGNNGADLITAVDWVFAQNENPDSQYHQKLDTSKIAAMGVSCGGLMSYGASSDPRITTIGILNSGLFARDQKIYDGLHGPVLILTGGPEDIAYENGKADFEAINREDIPLFYGYFPAVGHRGTYSRDNGGPFGKVTVAWMKWHLLGDESASAKGMFAGKDKPEVIDGEPWVTDSKNLK